MPLVLVNLEPTPQHISLAKHAHTLLFMDLLGVLFAMTGRIGLFIDALPIDRAAVALGFRLDFRRLRQYWMDRGSIIRANYYSAVTSNVGGYSREKPMLDWLAYNGYSVVTRRCIDRPVDCVTEFSACTMSVELTVDALELAPRLDDAVLIASNGDYRRLVERLQRQGVQVTVMSTTRAGPASVADELRRQADAFLDLKALQPTIGRLHQTATNSVEGIISH
jgi:uncharacterized LabA/DUF88 family protein